MSSFQTLDAALWKCVVNLFNETSRSLGEAVRIFYELPTGLQFVRAGLSSMDRSWSWIWDRSFWRKRTDQQSARRHDDTTNWVLARRGDKRALTSAFERFGPWIVAKPRRNVPWWCKGKTEVRILCEKLPRHQKMLDHMLSREDLVLERVNVETLDSQNRTGEYRSFWVVMSDGYQGAKEHERNSTGR